jgi:pimeloyl-ACP methyl ester carboxylesterase
MIIEFVWDVFVASLALSSGVLVLIFLILRNAFREWKRSSLENLSTKSFLVNTHLGVAEVATRGSFRGRTLVICHGGAMGSDNVDFYKQFRYYGYYVICVSRPGYLRTPLKKQNGEAFSFADMADLTMGVLQELGKRLEREHVVKYARDFMDQKVVIIGVSLGGPCAIQFALRYPTHTAGLILQSAVTGRYSLEGRESMVFDMLTKDPFRDIVMWMTHSIAKYFPYFVLKNILHECVTCDFKLIRDDAFEVCSHEKGKKLVHKMVGMMAPASARAAGIDHELELSGCSLLPYDLADIIVPTLITHSTNDRDVIASHALEARKMIKHSRIFLFQGFGHMFMFGKQWKVIRGEMLKFMFDVAPPSTLTE